MAPKDPGRQYPLYDTTYTLHRVTPLFTGPDVQLNNTALQQLARRFRDLLAGEVLRGVRVGLGPEDDVLARVGALQTVTWRLLPEEEAWVPDDETILGEDDTTMSPMASRGMLITVTYEKTVYRAILLRDLHSQGLDETMAGTEEDDGFQNFPLMLAKMPGALRETLIDFLTQSFDTRISPLYLSSAFLNNAFEQYLASLRIADDGSFMGVMDVSTTLKSVIKEIGLTIGFDLPGGATALKTVDISIAREDVPRMIEKGKETNSGSPFFDSLSAYVQAHMALDLRNERVTTLRIACGAFVLGSEGRLKLFQPSVSEDGNSPQSRATRKLVNDLIGAATLGGLLKRPEK